MLAEHVAERVTWGELGCPKAIGAYRLHGASVRVKNIHIIVAEDDPRAIFTVVTLHPPLGPPEFMLGVAHAPPDRYLRPALHLPTCGFGAKMLVAPMNDQPPGRGPRPKGPPHLPPCARIAGIMLVMVALRQIIVAPALPTIGSRARRRAPILVDWLSDQHDGCDAIVWQAVRHLRPAADDAGRDRCVCPRVGRLRAGAQYGGADRRARAAGRWRRRHPASGPDSDRGSPLAARASAHSVLHIGHVPAASILGPVLGGFSPIMHWSLILINLPMGWSRSS